MAKKSKIFILEMFSCLFTFLKYNVLYQIVDELLYDMRIDTGEFFSAMFLEYLTSFSQFEGEYSKHGILTSLSVFLSVKNHMERNPVFLKMHVVSKEMFSQLEISKGGADLGEVKFEGFGFDGWVLQESLIFLQKYVKFITEKDLSALSRTK